MSLIQMLLSTILVNNFVLVMFLGICPFLGISNRMSSAIGMGGAVTFVMTMATAICWPVYHLLLARYDAIFLEIAAFILVIASLVQLVEMFLKKTSPALYSALGIYLPLITTNCAILGAALLMVIRNYSFTQSVVFGLGSGIGFLLALVIMAGIREDLNYCDVPVPFRGVGISLILAAILSLSFMGFSGLIK
jgi:electron transport complex protein RnfA